MRKLTLLCKNRRYTRCHLVPRATPSQQVLASNSTCSAQSLSQLPQILSQLWGDSPANERIAGFPFSRRRKVNQESGPAALKDGYRLAIPEQDPVRRQ